MLAPGAGQGQRARARSRRLRFRHSDKTSLWRSQSSSQATEVDPFGRNARQSSGFWLAPSGRTMVLSARRRTAVKRGAFAVAIAIVFVALIAAPQVFHTSTPPSAPASEIADVTETSPDAGADVAVTLPRPSGLSTAAVARAGHSWRPRHRDHGRRMGSGLDRFRPGPRASQSRPERCCGRAREPLLRLVRLNRQSRRA